MTFGEIYQGMAGCSRSRPPTRGSSTCHGSLGDELGADLVPHRLCHRPRHRARRCARRRRRPGGHAHPDAGLADDGPGGRHHPVVAGARSPRTSSRRSTVSPSRPTTTSAPSSPTDGAPVTVQVERAGDLYDLTVDRPLQLPETGDTGFLGVRPESTLVRESPVGALAETGRLMGEVATGTLGGFGRLFSPTGLQNYAQQVADTTTGSGRPAHHRAQRPAPGRRHLVAAARRPRRTRTGPSRSSASSSSAPAPPRPAGSSCCRSWRWSTSRWRSSTSCRCCRSTAATPSSGSTRASAARSRARPYRADITKMMPLVYGVFGLLLLLGVSSILLDVLNPVSYGG